MKTFILSVCLLFGLSSDFSHAEEVAPGTPEALIHELYKAEDYIFSPAENKDRSAKFLAGTLMQLLILDAKRAGGEVGAIDFDVLSYSQDLREITKFATKSEVKGETAAVKTSFENHGERIVITFHCQKEAGQWRISDVSYEDGNSLLKLLKDASTPSK
jgi:hypothetical protein